MFAKAFGETFAAPIPIPFVLPPQVKPKALKEYPSIQTHIPEPLIPSDAIIQNRLKPMPLGLNRTQARSVSILSADTLNMTNPKNTWHNTSTYKDFQYTATLGYSQNALNERATAAKQATVDLALNPQMKAKEPYGEHEYETQRVTLKKEFLETYDFCSELHDTTKGPYRIECLQREFIQEGGQVGGILYPSQGNLKFWNSNKQWMDVKSVIKRMSLATDSADKKIQRQAILDFYGILVTPKSNLKIREERGVEIFWFSHYQNLNVPSTFLGRRIRTTLPYINTELGTTPTPTKKQVSMIYFTNLIVAHDLVIKVRVTTDDGFGTHFNSHIMDYHANRRANSEKELTLLSHIGLHTTTMTDEWTLKAKGINRLSGYLQQGIGGLYYKLEFYDGEGWGQIPEEMLTLSRHSFAPMFSFEVEKHPAKYGCDFPFCDQRFGGFKMKWKPKPGGGPSWNYSVVPNEDFPFGKSMMIFQGGPGGGIISNFSMKLYTFMTMTVLLSIQSIVPNGTDNIIVLESSLGQISIQITPVSARSVQVGLSTSKHGKTTDGPVLQLGRIYMLVVRMLRDEHDIQSLDSIQIGAATLKTLQVKPEELKESKPLLFKDPLQLENANTTNAYTMAIGGNSTMVIYWIRFFDYFMKPQHLKEEADDNWQI